MTKPFNALPMLLFGFLLAANTIQAYFGDHHYISQLKANTTLAKRADCTRYYGTEGSFCGLECGCNADDGQGNKLYCNAGICSITAPSTTACTLSASTCPNGEGCSFRTDKFNNDLICGGRYATCTRHDQCHGDFVCVSAEYPGVGPKGDGIWNGRADYGNCDYADRGQSQVCNYNDYTTGDYFCQTHEPLWTLGCGKSRTGSPLPGVCNGDQVSGCGLYENGGRECFWGYCINTGSGSNHCSWIPPPCDSDADCDNGLLCSPTTKMCGGVGVSCRSQDYCSDPYPCMDNGLGESFCQDYNAYGGKGSIGPPAINYQNDAGLWTVCDYYGSSNCGNFNCGQSRSESSEPGVCGGAYASCSSDSDCVTGGCDGNYCYEWPATYSKALGDSCHYSSECSDGLKCQDDGTGVASCSASNNRANICQLNWQGACSDDPNFPSCGLPRSGSTETGVCGGQGATCSSSSECFTGTCQSGACVFGDVPTTVITRRRRSSSNCPRGQKMCPVGNLGRQKNQLIMSGYECIDISSSLDSCGGCSSLGHGADCTAIEGAESVACVHGSCVIDSCEHGYSLADNGTTCLPY